MKRFFLTKDNMFTAVPAGSGVSAAVDIQLLLCKLSHPGSGTLVIRTMVQWDALSRAPDNEVAWGMFKVLLGFMLQIFDFSYVSPRLIAMHTLIVAGEYQCFETGICFNEEYLEVEVEKLATICSSNYLLYC